MTLRRSLSAIVLSAVLGTAVPSVFAALPGALDPVFDGDGKVIDEFPDATFSVANAVYQQGDGKLVVAGFRRDGSSVPDMAIARYNTDGSRDTLFSGDGRKVIQFAGGQSWAQAVAPAPGGKLLVAGSARNGTSMDFALVRLDASGNVDNTLGSGGGVLTGIGTGNDGAYAVVASGDGRIKAAGYSLNAGDNVSDFALVGYKSNGELDTNFGTGGKVVTTFGGDDAALAMVAQTDGKFVLGGYTESTVTGLRRFAMARYTAQGKLDKTFGTDGKVTTGFGAGTTSEAHGLLQLSNGKFLLVGCSATGTSGQYDVALARYTKDGVLDTNFGDSGIRTTDINGGDDCAYSAIQQYDGKLLLAGYANKGGANDDFLLVRYTASGKLDTGFGTNGKLTVAVTGSGAADRSVAAIQQADEQVVAVGFSGTKLAMVRYLFDDDDQDGITDSLDNCQYVSNPDQANHDSDTFGDACDDDDDNDGVKDVDDAFPFDPTESADNDGDGIGDNADPDDDNDGVLDGDDPFPLDPFLINRVTGDSSGDLSGYSVAMVGDIDSDGHADLLVGAPRNDVVLPGATKPAADVGSAWLSSGLTLEKLHTFSGKAKGDLFGSVVTLVGDVDGDGKSDIAIGAPGADQLDPVTGKVLVKDRGAVTIYSGDTLAELMTVNGLAAGDAFGNAVVNAGDANSDGRDDLLVGAWKADGVDGITGKTLKDAGAAYLVSGMDGSILQPFKGEVAGDYFGFSVAAGCDLDHDGMPELAIGAYRHDPVDPVTAKLRKDAGSVYLFRQTSPWPAVLPRLDGANKGDNAGYALAVVDSGADAFADLLVGLPGVDVTFGGKKLADAGQAALFADNSGVPLYTLRAAEPLAGSHFGAAVAAAGDVDQDGGGDVVVGAPLAKVTTPSGKLAKAGQIHVHRLVDGSPVFTLDGDTKGGQFGFAVAGGGDSNADGYDDVAGGAPYALYSKGKKAGVARVISGKEASKLAGP